MTTKSFLLTAWLYLSISVCHAQHTGNISYTGQPPAPVQNQLPVLQNPLAAPPILDPNYFYIKVDVLYNQVPDAYLAIFNVVQLGKDANEAHRLMQERSNGFLSDLAEIGIDQSNIFIDMISQIPIYEYQLQKKVFSKSYQEVPAGIELQKNLHIRFSDGSKMDRIMALAAQHEIYELIKVDYLVEDQSMILMEIRKKSFDYAMTQLATYEQLGVQYDTLPMIFGEKQEVTFPLQRYVSYHSKSGAALQSKIKDSSQVKQFRQAQTVFYQGIAPDEYEIVVNPMAKEPVVQYSYQLLLRYQRILPQPQVQIQKEIQREKEFIILTPDGNTRTLHLESQIERP